jgi:DNA-binding NtrC family response regulator
VNIRLIAATNRNLEQAIQEGRFRQDLYYRLNIVSVTLPPLRDRREDIPLLAAHFLDTHTRRYRKRLGGFAPDAMEALSAHAWPGNVREFDHAVERAVLLAEGERIRAADLALGPAADGAPSLEDMTLEEVERHLIRRALARFGGNVSDAARALGLSRSALYRRLQRFGL